MFLAAVVALATAAPQAYEFTISANGCDPGFADCRKSWVRLGLLHRTAASVIGTCVPSSHCSTALIPALILCKAPLATTCCSLERWLGLWQL